jgi:hypothetical protein
MMLGVIALRTVQYLAQYATIEAMLERSGALAAGVLHVRGEEANQILFIERAHAGGALSALWCSILT